MQKNKKIITVEVKAVNHLTGNIMESKGEINKTSEDGDNVANEDTLRFSGGDCGTSRMEASYNSSSQGTGEQTTEIELEVKASVLKDKKEIEVATGQSKLKTVFGGFDPQEKVEDYFNLKAETKCDSGCANVESYYSTKTTEITE